MEHVNDRAKLLDPMESLTNKNRNDVVACTNCGCTFMEQVEIKQFKKDHAVILGQKPPTVDPVIFYMLRCAKCKELHEPTTIYSGSQNYMRKVYDRFLEQIEENTKGKKGEHL